MILLLQLVTVPGLTASLLAADHSAGIRAKAASDPITITTPVATTEHTATQASDVLLVRYDSVKRVLKVYKPKSDESPEESSTSASETSFRSPETKHTPKLAAPKLYQIHFGSSAVFSDSSRESDYDEGFNSKANAFADADSNETTSVPVGRRSNAEQLEAARQHFLIVVAASFLGAFFAMLLFLVVLMMLVRLRHRTLYLHQPPNPRGNHRRGLGRWCVLMAVPRRTCSDQISSTENGCCRMNHAALVYSTGIGKNGSRCVDSVPTTVCNNFTGNLPAVHTKPTTTTAVQVE